MALTKVPSNLDATVAITQSASDNSTNIATTAYVTTAIANLVDGAPSTLNTLDEIAAALNDDAALNTTLTNSIATKLPLAGGTLTGGLTINHANGLFVHDTNGTSTNKLKFLYNGTSGVATLGPDSASGNTSLAIGTSSATAGFTTALTLDSSQNATFAGTISSGGITINGAGSVISDSSDLGIVSGGNLTMDITGELIIDTDLQGSGNGILLKDGGTLYGSIFRSSSHLHIKAEAQDKNLLFLTNSGGTERTAMTIDYTGRVGINRTPSISNSKLEVGGADDVSLINVEASGNTGGLGIGSTGLKLFHGSSAKMTINSSGNVGIGYTSVSSDNKLQVDGKGYFGPVGTGQGDSKANMGTNAVLQLKPHDSNSTNMTFAQVNGGNGIGIQVSNSSQTADWNIALNPYGGGVAIGGTSVSSGVKLEVTGGRIYVPNSTVQASSALIGGHTNYKWYEQPTGNSATSPSANKSAAYIGSNSSSRGIVIQRDSIGNTFPDFAITESGYIYANNNITMQNGGSDSADYRSGAAGYVNWGSKIESHEWKNWAATGNYTARLYTPIKHNEGSMFIIEVECYGYGTGGRVQKYIAGGYAYAATTLIAEGTAALVGTLTHRLTTATHPNFNQTVVCFDLGHTNNNGTAYYNHMRWRFQGWNGKRAEDFVWAAVTT